ncbi:hypothetical protein GCM10023066_55430 [Nocardioides kongjuensis]
MRPPAQTQAAPRTPVVLPNGLAITWTGVPLPRKSDALTMKQARETHHHPLYDDRVER